MWACPKACRKVPVNNEMNDVKDRCNDEKSEWTTTCHHRSVVVYPRDLTRFYCAQGSPAYKRLTWCRRRRTIVIQPADPLSSTGRPWCHGAGASKAPKKALQDQYQGMVEALFILLPFVSCPEVRSQMRSSFLLFLRHLQVAEGLIMPLVNEDLSVLSSLGLGGLPVMALTDLIEPTVSLNVTAVIPCSSCRQMMMKNMSKSLTIYLRRCCFIVMSVDSALARIYFPCLVSLPTIGLETPIGKPALV